MSEVEIYFSIAGSALSILTTIFTGFFFFYRYGAKKALTRKRLDDAEEKFRELPCKAHNDKLQEHEVQLAVLRDRISQQNAPTPNVPQQPKQ